jgi:hypothetical protein
MRAGVNGSCEQLWMRSPDEEVSSVKQLMVNGETEHEMNEIESAKSRETAVIETTKAKVERNVQVSQMTLNASNLQSYHTQHNSSWIQQGSTSVLS